jgi:hypothetical protein
MRLATLLQRASLFDRRIALFGKFLFAPFGNSPLLPARLKKKFSQK